MAIPLDTIINGILIFLRISGILFFLPIFGDSPTPIRVRLLLALAFTLSVYHFAYVKLSPVYFTDIVALAFLISKELFIGLIIGILSRFMFEGLIVGANLVGYQMGFGVANLFMPNAEETLNGFSALHRVIVMIIFLTLNLHYIFIKALVSTFEIIPLGLIKFNHEVGSFIISASSNIFVTALQLASPILVALMFTMGALGLIARNVPQVNVFLISFPLSFFVGLLVYFANIAFFPEIIEYQFQNVDKNIMLVLKALIP